METEEKYTVFIVDDDSDDVEMLVSAFEKLHCTHPIQSFSSGEQLLKTMETLPQTELPQLVILDHQLPGAAGSETLLRLRANEKYKAVAIVVYSTSIPPQKITFLEEHGANLCLLKGNSVSEISEQVKSFCSLAALAKKNMENNDAK